ncbi:hypothetical protein [Pseudanabaena minima]|uniref:hypothetical protein n=1 Tax=Pseudanabaena minima TaxID=890415 RepID=UPI003DA8CE30
MSSGSGGVLIFKGMKVSILAGDLSIGISDNGEFSSHCILSTSYNVIPIWMKIAHDNLRQSRIASEAILEKWSEDADFQKQLLMGELAPSMQVIVACGIALDALYDTLRPYAKITPEEIESWKKNKTARAKQIVEIIKRAYKLKPDIFNNFKECISEIIKLRDKAVHPSLELQNVCGRSDIDVAVDWKFAVYRYENAKRVFINTGNIIAYLYEHKSNINELDEALFNIIEALKELGIISSKSD